MIPRRIHVIIKSVVVLISKFRIIVEFVFKKSSENNKKNPPLSRVPNMCLLRTHLAHAGARIRIKHRWKSRKGVERRSKERWRKRENNRVRLPRAADSLRGQWPWPEAEGPGEGSVAPWQFSDDIHAAVLLVGEPRGCAGWVGRSWPPLWWGFAV